MKKSRREQRVLGVAATGRGVHAVLVQAGPDGPEVLRHFSRQRSTTASGFAETPTRHVPPEGDKYGGVDDFTIEFGDANASNPNLFLSAEFGAADDEGNEDLVPAATFELELSDVLSECRDAGFGDAALSFALSAADVTFTELRMPAKKRHDHAVLVDALAAQYKGLFDDERVAFLPMTEADASEVRYLAVFPRMLDPVTATLRALRDTREGLPHVSLVDAELPLLVGLARVAADAFESHRDERVADAVDDENDESPSEPGFNTLVVRAGAEETLVLFLRGGAIHHCEVLRSLTAFDVPETICSRVLLQQDEHGVGDVQHVLVLSEEREKELVDTFGMFFSEATVEPLRLYVPSAGEGDEDTATALVAATAAGLRALGDPTYAASFEKLNFLPKKLLKRKVRLPVTWHGAFTCLLTVVTTIFFMARYTTAETEIEYYRELIEEVAPGSLGTDLGVLQARIDSMQSLYATYTRALQVLDTLLIGSDRWSRLLETTAKEASSVRGIWVDTFTPAGSTVQITGNATSRNQVVDFASRLDGTIESLIFSEIREWPVYTYSLKISTVDSLPAAARFLRENVRLDEGSTGDQIEEDLR